MKPQTHKLSIKQLDASDRPREKALDKGINVLSNAELIAILIGSGSVNESAVALSQRVLIDYGNNWSRLAKLSIKELIKRYAGIGEAKALSIVAALEIGRRRVEEGVSSQPRISSGREVHAMMYRQLVDLPHEEFWVLLLNGAHRVVDKVCVSQGGIGFASVDIKLVLKPALIQSVSNIILVHNHPTNTLRPSEQDMVLTAQIVSAAKIIGICVLDHVIVCEAGYYSFADARLLD